MKKINSKSFCKGSFTVEGAILIPLFLLIFATAILLGIGLYTEIKSDPNAFATDDLWEVSNFYKYENAGDALND